MNTDYNAFQVELRISMWGGEAIDRPLARQAEDAAMAERGTMKVVKELIPVEFIQPIKRAAGRARTIHYEMTLPGMTKGTGLLATKLYSKYFDRLSAIKDEFDEAVREFVGNYPDILANAEARFGSAYGVGDYPTQADMEKRFDFNVRAFPIPSGKDWRLEGVIDAHLESMKEQVDEDVRAMYVDATQELYERLHGVVARCVNQLKNSEAIVRKQSLENLREMAELVPAMNIAHDKRLHDMAKEIQSMLTGVDAVSVNNSANLRAMLRAGLEKVGAS